MFAVQIKKAGAVDVIDVEKPSLEQPDQVLVKTKRVGICGSDLHIYHGTNPFVNYPRIIGHEVAGQVVAVGPSVQQIKVGDHVVVEPIRACGTCYACRRGRPNVCAALSVFGVHEDGGMREYFSLPEKQIHVVSPDLDWDEVVLAEPYTIGAQAVWRGKVRQDDTVFIQGAGPIGICVLKMAKLIGAYVIISDLRKERLEFAKANGADEVIWAGREDVEKKVLKLTAGVGPNVVIDAVCLPQTFELSVRVASVAGTVVCLGFDEQPAAISQLPITKKELTIVGSRLQTHQFKKVIPLLNNGKLKADGLITHRFPLSAAKEAFSFVESNPDGVRKVIITFD